MVKSIKWNKNALNTFYKIATYLEENHSLQSAKNFVKSVFDKIEIIKKHPTVGRKAPKRKTIRFVLIGKHRRLYYRIQGTQLIISSLFDTRQHFKNDRHQ